MKGLWSVERRCYTTNRWVPIAGAAGLKSYARGWYDALTSMTPRPGYRLVDDKDQERSRDVGSKLRYDTRVEPISGSDQEE